MRCSVLLSFVRRRFAPLVAVGLVVVVIPSAVSATVLRNSVDSPVDAGSVTIIAPQDASSPMTSGDSNSVFQLVLPEGASCPGDSFYDDWRVQSFFIPEADDPGALRYGVIWPDGEGRRSLYTVSTQPFVHVGLGRSDGEGEPGPILQPEAMTFAVYPAGLFPPGSYRIGLACSKYRETAVYWDTEITVADASDVKPGGFEWSLAEGASAVAPGPGNSGGSGPWIPLITGLLVAAGVVVVLRRRHSTTQHLTPEEQH